MVFGASAPKQYKTDYLVFNYNNKTVVFKNENGRKCFIIATQS
jgi:hypothetical protein